MCILEAKEVLIIAECEIVFELEHIPPCMNLLFTVKEYTRLFACLFFPPNPLIVFTLNGQISFSCGNNMLNKKLDFCVKNSNVIFAFFVLCSLI